MMTSPQALIFLDFDGVLNSRDFERRVPKRLRRPNLDPRAVERLNDLVRRSRAAVVFSTAWRIGRTVQQLRDLLVKVGFKYPGRVISSTPDLDGQRLRGDEIELWRQRARGRARLPLVILDDLEDMGHLAPFLVRTDVDTGLTRQDVELALTILKAQS